jgi:putative ABC transport system permease protein
MPLRLLLKNVLRHPVRAVLTALSVTVAVFLMCFLHAGVAGLTRTIEAASQSRLFVQSAVSLFVDLPLAYQQKIAQVPGIEAICKWQWFGGRYEQEKGGYFAQFGIDADSFLPSYPEIEIVEGSYERFRQERTACLVGQDLASTYGWQVGQTVPLRGTIFTRTDGQPWEFTIAGLYRSNKASIDQQTLYFHFDYLDESLQNGGAIGPRGVGVYLLRLAPGADAVAVMQGVDALFENGPQRVQTTTEGEFSRQFISMLGDVPTLLKFIGSAVLFAIFFAVLNTMLMAGREKTRELGMLKALGFRDGTVGALLVGESVLVCGLGALLGVAITKALDAPFQAMMGASLPGFQFDGTTLLFGTGVSLGLGLLAGIAPAVRASRLSVLQALREVG